MSLFEKSSPPELRDESHKIITKKRARYIMSLAYHCPRTWCLHPNASRQSFSLHSTFDNLLLVLLFHGLSFSSGSSSAGLTARANSGEEEEQGNDRRSVALAISLSSMLAVRSIESNFCLIDKLVLNELRPQGTILGTDASRKRDNDQVSISVAYEPRHAEQTKLCSVLSLRSSLPFYRAGCSCACFAELPISQVRLSRVGTTARKVSSFSEMTEAGQSERCRHIRRCCARLNDRPNFDSQTVLALAFVGNIPALQHTIDLLEGAASRTMAPISGDIFSASKQREFMVSVLIGGISGGQPEVLVWLHSWLRTKPDYCAKKTNLFCFTVEEEKRVLSQAALCISFPFVIPLLLRRIFTVSHFSQSAEQFVLATDPRALISLADSQLSENGRTGSGSSSSPLFGIRSFPVDHRIQLLLTPERRKGSKHNSAAESSSQSACISRDDIIDTIFRAPIDPYFPASRRAFGGRLLQQSMLMPGPYHQWDMRSYLSLIVRATNQETFSVWMDTLCCPSDHLIASSSSLNSFSTATAKDGNGNKTGLNHHSAFAGDFTYAAQLRPSLWEKVLKTGSILRCSTLRDIMLKYPVGNARREIEDLLRRRTELRSESVKASIGADRMTEEEDELCSVENAIQKLQKNSQPYLFDGGIPWKKILVPLLSGKTCTFQTMKTRLVEERSAVAELNSSEGGEEEDDADERTEGLTGSDEEEGGEMMNHQPLEFLKWLYLLEERTTTKSTDDAANKLKVLLPMLYCLLGRPVSKSEFGRATIFEFLRWLELRAEGNRKKPTPGLLGTDLSGAECRSFLYHPPFVFRSFREVNPRISNFTPNPPATLFHLYNRIVAKEFRGVVRSRNTTTEDKNRGMLHLTPLDLAIRAVFCTDRTCAKSAARSQGQRCLNTDFRIHQILSLKRLFDIAVTSRAATGPLVVNTDDQEGKSSTTLYHSSASGAKTNLNDSSSTFVESSLSTCFTTVLLSTINFNNNDFDGRLVRSDDEETIDNNCSGGEAAGENGSPTPVATLAFASELSLLIRKENQLIEKLIQHSDLGLKDTPHEELLTHLPLQYLTFQFLLVAFEMCRSVRVDHVGGRYSGGRFSPFLVRRPADDEDKSYSSPADIPNLQDALKRRFYQIKEETTSKKTSKFMFASLSKKEDELGLSIGGEMSSSSSPPPPVLPAKAEVIPDHAYLLKRLLVSFPSSTAQEDLTSLSALLQLTNNGHGSIGDEPHYFDHHEHSLEENNNSRAAVYPQVVLLAPLREQMTQQVVEAVKFDLFNSPSSQQSTQSYYSSYREEGLALTEHKESQAKLLVRCLRLDLVDLSTSMPNPFLRKETLRSTEGGAPPPSTPFLTPTTSSNQRTILSLRLLEEPFVPLGYVICHGLRTFSDTFFRAIRHDVEVIYNIGRASDDNDTELVRVLSEMLVHGVLLVQQKQQQSSSKPPAEPSLLLEELIRVSCEYDLANMDKVKSSSKDFKIRYNTIEALSKRF